jgi:hypothetical protein
MTCNIHQEVREKNSVSSRPRWIALGAIVALAIVAATGCGEPQVSIYVDNGGAEEMTVEVNSQTACTVPPGEHKAIHLPPGDYRFVVSRAGETLYDGMRTLEPSEHFGFGREYVWNPGREHFYAACKVDYGSRALKDAAQSAIVKLAEAHTGQKADPVHVEFLQLKRYAEPMPSTDWFELPRGIQYILRDAPEHVYTKTGSDTRRALTRVSRDVHELLLRTHAVEHPTPEDLEILRFASDEAIASLADLEPIYP